MHQKPGHVTALRAMAGIRLPWIAAVAAVVLAAFNVRGLKARTLQDAAGQAVLAGVNLG